MLLEIEKRRVKVFETFEQEKPLDKNVLRISFCRELGVLCTRDIAQSLFTPDEDRRATDRCMESPS